VIKQQNIEIVAHPSDCPDFIRLSYPASTVFRTSFSVRFC
jgi:hypothetical protein